jgi:hypothetical protein
MNVEYANPRFRVAAIKNRPKLAPTRAVTSPARASSRRRGVVGLPTVRTMMIRSVPRGAMLRVQCRTPGQRVAKNHHVRRQLCCPRSFPLSQNLARCCTKHCNRVPRLHLFHAAPPKSTHRQSPHSFAPNISNHPDELGLHCVKPRAEQEPELGRFLALPVVARDRVGANRLL